MGTLKDWITRHPNLSAWFVLALGMDILLVVEARDVGLETSQWFWLLVITTLVAGACIWIVSWGDDEADSLSADEPVAEIDKHLEDEASGS